MPFSSFPEGRKEGREGNAFPKGLTFYLILTIILNTNASKITRKELLHESLPLSDLRL